MVSDDNEECHLNTCEPVGACHTAQEDQLLKEYNCKVDVSNTADGVKERKATKVWTIIELEKIQMLGADIPDEEFHAVFISESVDSEPNSTVSSIEATEESLISLITQDSNNEDGDSSFAVHTAKQGAHRKRHHHAV